jgi:TPR repeat protein
VPIVRTALAALALIVTACGSAASSPLSDGVRAFWRGDYSVAARVLLPLADRGSAEAQALVGYMYEYGRGVPQNAVVAVNWYQCAAEQGNPLAQYQLGLLYNKGQGVQRSAVIAYMWLDLAAAHAPAGIREAYIRTRNAVASKLNPAQMAEAQALAYNFVPKSRQ